MSQSIITTLRQIGNGSLVTSMENNLQKLVQAVDESGKAGKLTIVIDVKKATKGNAMNIKGQTKLTAPSTEHHESLMFATEEGELVTENPKQQKLDLNVVNANKGEIKNVNEAR
ncbi:hypothetical protein SAMN05216302_101470 [Nitrosomonas aestuarii]|uniref:Uncharacterized protein n=1 Tax=Nitrosomonas aestuarii TaxID=52441 RepID=A0A1I4C4S3_9PROT|nr:hypothetical protein [Nitrosomonas aestuarii]SFK75397.1 hypothetical protein SAMN05216302_101470 [Nitrosomonas aestuarii]